MTCRWPVALFYNMIDVSAVIVYVVWQQLKSPDLKVLKGGESSSQFRWFTIAKIELQFLIFFALILGLRLQRYSTNTKRCSPEKSFWQL